MLRWRHSGFSVHNRIRSNAADANGRQRLARYMIRCPFALEKMRYNGNSGMVIYRSRLHATLKRNYQLMPVNAQRKASRARLIQKVYEVDPLKCTRCGGPDPPWPKGETMPLTYHPVPDIA